MFIHTDQNYMKYNYSNVPFTFSLHKKTQKNFYFLGYTQQIIKLFINVKTSVITVKKDNVDKNCHSTFLIFV